MRYNADIYVDLKPAINFNAPFELLPKEKQIETDDLFRQSPDAETMQNGGGRLKI